MAITVHPAPTSTEPVSGAAPELVRVLLLAVLTGVALGVGDLWAQDHLKPPLLDLVDSSSGWAGATLLFGLLLRTHLEYAALAGAVMLLVAVEAYYICELGVLQPDPTAWNSESAQYWAVIALPAGIVFGAAGALCRDGLRLLREVLTGQPSG